MRIIKLTEHWGNLKEEAQNLWQGNMFFAIKKMLLRINQPDFHIHMSISEKKAWVCFSKTSISAGVWRNQFPLSPITESFIEWYICDLWL